MKKFIFMVLLTMINHTALAEWTFIEGNDKQKAYADPATLHKMGDRVIIWSMLDLKDAAKLSDGKPFLSWTTQYEFECKKRQSRILAASMHSEKMGGGEITNSLDFESPQWEVIASNSKGEALWKFACDKK
jgi:hypothetical protein